jgi:hypothetical protein
LRWPARDIVRSTAAERNPLGGRDKPMHYLSLHQQLAARRAWVKHLGWVTGVGVALAAASMFFPLVFSQFAPSMGLRVVVALASGVLAVGAVIAARWPQSRLADFESAIPDLVQQARDLKARAASDPAARAEYIAYLRLTRDELLSIPRRLKRHMVVTERELLPALEAVDAEIASYEEAFGPSPSYPSIACADTPK